MIIFFEDRKSVFDVTGTVKSASSSAEPDAGEQLKRYEAECLKCELCALRSGCSRVVFGDGNPQASLVLVGEGPGAEEDRLGKPFVGAAGKLLNQILAEAQIDREEIYIANIVKCRPPGNRLPLQPEVDACLPHLKKQLSIIDPDIIVCMGALATRSLIDRKATITRSRGQWYEIDKRKYMATFHPAALLRDPGRKKYSWEDFKQISVLYSKLGNGGRSG